MEETTNIYVLSLQGGRIYVGKSNDVKKRFEQHKAGNGSVWTSKHKPIEILKVIEHASPFDEDRYVKEYMMKYGIENVRGGSYCSTELSDEQIASIQQEIRGATDCCAKCGRRGHFANKCYAKTDVNGNKLGDDFDDDTSDYDSSDCEIDVIKCSKCKKYGHYASTCFVKTDKFKSNNTCYRCGRSGHYSPDCYASKHVNGYYLD
jgi:predicted GIY-YIG superfamily endonuclease